MPKKRNRSTSSPKKVIRASLSSAINNPELPAAVAEPASDKLAVSKLDSVNDDCLFSYGPVTQYFHNVTSREFRQQRPRPESLPNVADESSRRAVVANIFPSPLAARGSAMIAPQIHR